MCYSLCKLLIVLLIPTFSNAINTIEPYESINEKTQIMLEYFQWKNLRFGIIINCCDNLALKKIVYQFSKKMISIFIIKDIIHLQNYLNFKIDFHHIGIVLDLECPLAVSVLKYSSDNDMFNIKYHWLVFHSQNYTNNIFKTIHLPIDSDLLIIQRQLFNNLWILNELYNPGLYHGGKLKDSYYGTWRKEIGFKIYVNNNKYIRRQNTGGLILRSAFVLRCKLKIPAMDYLTTQKYFKFDVYTRFHYRIIENIKHMYNFRFKYIRASDWVNGLVQNLVDKKVDIGTSGVFINKERVPKVHICPYGLFPFRICFLFRHPKPNSGGVNDTYLRPLTYSVWTLSVFSALLIIILLKITTITETCKLIKESYSESSWSMATFTTFGALVQQGIDSTPILFSGRIIVYTLLIFSSLLYQFYSASIVSSLLMDPPKTIKTLQDLLESPLEVGVDDEPYIVSWYKDIKNPTEIQIYEKKIMRENKHPPQIYSITSGVNKVHQGGFAFETMIPIASELVSGSLGWTEREICDLSQIEMRPPQRLFFICQKKSPFKKLFNIGILKQAERGITAHDTKIWLQQIPECTVDAFSSSTFSVQLSETASAFAVLGFGITISIVVLLLEIIISTKRTKSKAYVIKK